VSAGHTKFCAQRLDGKQCSCGWSGVPWTEAYARLEAEHRAFQAQNARLRKALVDAYEFHQRTECIGGGVDADPCTCSTFDKVRAALAEPTP
jgi:hypothetical protein